MKNSCLLPKSYQSSKDCSKREPHPRQDLCSMLLSVRGLVSCCNSQSPQCQKGQQIAVMFSTTILYAINQWTSLENPHVSYWDPKWTSTSLVLKQHLSLARVSQIDFLSFLGGYVCTFHVAVPSCMTDATWTGKQSSVVQGRTLQLCAKYIFIICIFIIWHYILATG